MIFRNLRLSILVAGGMLLGAIGAVLAQAGWQPIASPTGTELIQAFVNSSAYQNYVTLNQIRNATGYQYLASASGTIAPTNAVASLLVNAQPAAATTIDTPTSPYDAEMFRVCNVSNAAWATNTVTLAAASGSSLATGVTTALTTLAARTCVELQYVSTNTTWYQVR